MKYRFYLVTTEGVTLVWTGLTLTQAKAMHRATATMFNVLQSSTEVKRFGWEEMA